MKKYLLLLVLTLLFSSCNVTESIIFNKDGSGEFLVSYDMGEAMEQMADAFGGDTIEDDEASEKQPGKIMDTTMVFADIMEQFKDSVAALPEDKRLAMEAVKDMYMTMQMNEDEGTMNFGMGMNFKSIKDLKDIQEKMRKIQSLNEQGGQIDAMKSGSPIGKFMGDDNNNVVYEYSKNGFARITTITHSEGDTMEDIEDDENDKEFMDFFKHAYYNVKLTFPKKIKSTTIEGAEISKDGKSVSYKTNWLDYIKNPKQLDVDIKFE